MDTTFPLDTALQATGALLARRGRTSAIVIVGGTALKDLMALGPVFEELTAAQEWIATQDPSLAMSAAVAKVIGHVRAARR